MSELFESEKLFFGAVSGLGYSVFRGKQSVPKDFGDHIFIEFVTYSEPEFGSMCITRELVEQVTCVAKGDADASKMADEVIALFEPTSELANTHVKLDLFKTSVSRSSQREIQGVQVQRESRKCRVSCRVSYER